MRSRLFFFTFRLCKHLVTVHCCHNKDTATWCRQCKVGNSSTATNDIPSWLTPSFFNSPISCYYHRHQPYFPTPFSCSSHFSPLRFSFFWFFLTTSSHKAGFIHPTYYTIFLANGQHFVLQNSIIIAKWVNRIICRFFSYVNLPTLYLTRTEKCTKQKVHSSSNRKCQFDLV